MGKLGGFVEEDVLHNQAIQRFQRRFHVLGIRV